MLTEKKKHKKMLMELLMYVQYTSIMGEIMYESIMKSNNQRKWRQQASRNRYEKFSETYLKSHTRYEPSYIPTYIHAQPTWERAKSINEMNVEWT